jgi:hypothetical protein
MSLRAATRYARTMLSRWMIIVGPVLISCGNNTAQGGAVNVPSLNRPWGPEDRGHDVIANGPEACGPSKNRPEGAKLPQCPEQASSAKGRSAAAPAASGTGARR